MWLVISTDGFLVATDSLKALLGKRGITPSSPTGVRQEDASQQSLAENSGWQGSLATAGSQNHGVSAFKIFPTLAHHGTAELVLKIVLATSGEP